jgi:outer membrane lipoprotein-sorting protein
MMFLALWHGAADAIAESPTAQQIIERAINRTRGLASHAVLNMQVVRPAWQRSTTIETWTRGREDALIRFVAPARDAGNATLKLGASMWTYTPKLNRTIRLPVSLMSQSWSGTDFSYDDLSRTDNLLQHYDLTIDQTEVIDGVTVYTISAIPRADAPVVWGKEELRIREDDVVIEQTFFDQELEPVKRLSVLAIGEMGGRTIGTHLRMYKFDSPDQYTELRWEAAEFDVELGDEHFTLFNLQKVP